MALRAQRYKHVQKRQANDRMASDVVREWRLRCTMCERDLPDSLRREGL